MKLYVWIDTWLENYVKPSVKTRTYERYSALSEHFLSHLGEQELATLSAPDVQFCIGEMLKTGNKRTGTGLSPSTVNTIITVLQSALKEAFLVGVVGSYIGDKIKRPRNEEREMQVFSNKEQKQIEEAVMRRNKHKFYGIILCLYTGLRIGELLALKKENVNLPHRLIFVESTAYDGSDGTGHTCRCEGSTKTRSSKRLIPIPRAILPLVRTLYKTKGSDYLISENGKPISVRSYQRSFELLLKKEKIPHRGFHTLRHTFATRALECGMDIKTLSELLGHKNPNTTLSRYAHSLIEHKYTMMNKLGRLFSCSQNDTFDEQMTVKR